MIRWSQFWFPYGNKGNQTRVNIATFESADDQDTRHTRVFSKPRATRVYYSLLFFATVSLGVFKIHAFFPPIDTTYIRETVNLIIAQYILLQLFSRTSDLPSKRQRFSNPWSFKFVQCHTSLWLLCALTARRNINRMFLLLFITWGLFKGNN